MRIETMTAIDLPEALHLNNRILDSVDWLTEQQMSYLFQNAYSFLAVKDKDTLVGFLISLAPGLDYDCHAYVWYGKNIPHAKYIFVDRIVVNDAY